MPRNHTIVSTNEPVCIEAFLASHGGGPAAGVPTLEFEIGGQLITSRALEGRNEPHVVRRLLSQPTHLHLMAVEEEDRTVKGMLFVTFPRDGAPEPWAPNPFYFSAPEGEIDAPQCFPLGPCDLDGGDRVGADDFVLDAKSMLHAVSGIGVTDAAERAIDELIRSTGAAA